LFLKKKDCKFSRGGAEGSNKEQDGREKP